MTKILHIGPPKHGIADFAAQIDIIYRNQGFEVEPVSVDNSTNLDELTRRLASQEDAVYHFEMGSGDSAVFELGRKLLEQNGRQQLVTVHDPGVVVWHPVIVSGVDSPVRIVQLAAKVVRKLGTKLIGLARVKRYVDDPRIHRIYLRPDLAKESHSYYLPHPTYHNAVPNMPAAMKPPLRVGFGGYWGAGKGLETLLEAVKLVRKSRGVEAFTLVLGGGSAGTDDLYAKSIRTVAQQFDANTELPGFIADNQLDQFLQSLAVLILPYWPELPNGTSGMALRAAELGVPVIASDTLALREQFGPDGAVYVEPKNAEALAAAIGHLLREPQAAQELAKRTQQKIFAEHNWTVVGQKLRKIVAAVEGGQA